MVVTMSGSGHFRDLSKFANSLKSRSKSLVVSSKEVELTGPDNGWWVQLQKVIRDSTRVKLIIVLLVVKISGVQFEA